MGSPNTLDARTAGPSRPPIPQAAANFEDLPHVGLRLRSRATGRARALMHADPHPVVGNVSVFADPCARSRSRLVSRGPPLGRASRRDSPFGGSPFCFHGFPGPGDAPP